MRMKGYDLRETAAYLVAIVLAILAFLSDYFPFSLFLGLRLYPGSLFGFLGVLLVGKGQGFAMLLAGAFAAALRGEYVYCACAVLEAFFVLIAFRGLRRNIALIITSYWLGFGFWLALAAMRLCGIATQEALLSAALFAIIGIASATIASLANDYVRAAFPRRLEEAGLVASGEIPYRRLLFEGGLTISLVPLIALLVMMSQSRILGLRNEFERRLDTVKRSYALVADIWIEEKESELGSIAEVVNDVDRFGERLSDRLSGLRATEPNIVSVGVLDATGRIAEVSSDSSKRPLDLPGTDLSKEKAYRASVEFGGACFDAVPSAEGDPLFVMVQHLSKGGRAVFYVIDSKPFYNLLSGLAKPLEADACVVSPDDRSIVDTAESRSRIRAFSLREGYAPIGTSSGQWQRVGLSAIEVPGYYLEADARLGPGWRVFFFLPIAPFRSSVIGTGLGISLFSLALVLVIVGVTALSSRLLVSSVVDLRKVADRFVENPESPMALPWPESRVEEVASLSRSFAAAGKHIDRRYREAVSALAEAERASAQRERILAAVSHDIRGPLGGMVDMARLLERELEEGEARERARIIAETGGDLRGLVEALLDRTAIEAGRLELRESPFDLRILFDGVTGAYRLAAEAKSLDLRLEWDEDLPRHVVGDRARLYQVLGNLVGNAVKYTERGWIKVSARREAGEGGWASLRFEVEDTGPGIPEGKLELIFMPFFRAAGNPDSIDGRGLGLSISRDIVELMGGELRVEQAPEGGSIFVLRVKLALAASKPDASSSIVSLAGKAFAPALVLVADDQRINRALARYSLEAAGHRVEEASDGRAAVDAVLGADFDVAFLDINMPRLDGRAAAREILDYFRGKAGGLRPYLVAFSSSKSGGDKPGLLDGLFDECIAKPAPSDRLLAALASARAWAAAQKVKQEALLDYEGLLCAYGGDHSFLRTILEAFVADGSKYISVVRSAASAQSRDRLLGALHSLVNVMGAGRAQAALSLLRSSEKTLRASEELGPELLASAELARALVAAEQAIEDASSRLEEERKT
jgi:signal transduction histidine kinase/AmiR/NasT family two-component response regulator